MAAVRSVTSGRGRLPLGYLAQPSGVAAFEALCADPAGGVEVEFAADLVANVPVYDGEALRGHLDDAASVRHLTQEWAEVLAHGPGVFAVRRAYGDPADVAAMTAVFWRIIEAERAEHRDVGDHFAASGSNTRVWNVLQKSAAEDPHAYVRYYANPLLHLAAEAWLGPWYQLTAQVNVVHPGGAAQSPHRDYHLGFQSDEDAARFPAHVHLLSQVLTLQGAVAHSEMPLESGPTLLLPGSQRFLPGYLAWRDPRFAEVFDRHAVQVPLETGDALFLNPALHHAAGENRTADHDRIANLVQISSAFGVPMERVDRYAITRTVYPALRDLVARGDLDAHEHRAAIAACADGYPFPTNLDTDPPVDGLAPASAQGLLARALEREWPDEVLAAELHRAAARRRP